MFIASSIEIIKFNRILSMNCFYTVRMVYLCTKVVP